jgi:hypothetical protein
VIRRLALTVLVVAALAPALRGDAAPPVLIQPGVTLAGIDVGGMSNEQAQAALRPAFARPVRLRDGDRRFASVRGRQSPTASCRRSARKPVRQSLCFRRWTSKRFGAS